MKTVNLTFSVSRGGGLFDSVRRLAQSLQVDQGIETEVLGLSDNFTDTDVPLWHPVRVRTCAILGPRRFGYSPQLQSQLFRTDTDLLHVHGLWTYTSIASLRWSKQTSKPLIISIHGMLNPWALRISAWKKRFAKLLYENQHLRRAACIRALSVSEAKAIRMYGLQNPIAVIPNGVDIPNGLKVDAPSWAGKIGDGDKILLYLGRLHPNKGLLNLLRAWKEVRRSAPPAVKNWYLAIAGLDQSGYEHKLKSMIRDGGLENIFLLGPKFGEEKAAAFAHSDAFILPSYGEGLPLAVLEAWAYSLPVVMTEECNLPQGFSAGAALKVRPETEDIADGMREIFSMSDSQRREVGEHGKSLVQQNFSWEKVSGEMWLVYKWMLGLVGRPDSVLTSETLVN